MRMQTMDHLLSRAGRLTRLSITSVASSVAIVALLASCAQPSAIRRPAPPAPPEAVAAAPAPELPPADSVIVSKLIDPAVAERVALSVPPAAQAPALRPAHIALLIPANSKNLAQAAEAVKLGFTAGAQAEGANALAFRIYASDDEVGSLAAQYRKAAQEGAVAMVGGITRDGANALAKESGRLPTLALNAPTEADLPDRFFYISLNIDNEARQLARAAAQAGFRRAAVLVGGTPLAKRIQDSFEREWSRLGGQIAVRTTLSGEANAYAQLHTTIERATADMAFIAADSTAARNARPYLPTALPVFATSHSLDARAQPVQNVDLESVRFLEMPWFVEKDHPAVMAYAKPANTLPLDYERLYALGVDAWRLAQIILKTERTRDIAPLDGVTGKLTLDGAQFVRTLTSIEMRDGVPYVFRSGE